MSIDWERLGGIFQIPIFRRWVEERILAFRHPDPVLNNQIQDALEVREDFTDLEDVLEDEPIN